MSKGFLAEIVRVDTEDDITLTGMVIRPTISAVRPLPIVWIHGYTGNFHEDTTCRMGPELAARGFTFIAGDGRGHDFGVVLRKKGPEVSGQETWLGGAGWEKFSESRYDIAAWIGFAKSLGFPGIILLGHSYGGTKSITYMGQTRDERVKGLIVASSGALIHDHWARPDLADDARKMVAEGQGETLMLIPGDRPSWISATAFLDRFESSKVVNGQTTGNAPVANVDCPILSFLGTKEGWIGGEDHLELLKKQAVSAPRVDLHLIEGGDHWYQGTEKAVADIIANWAATL